MTPREKVRNSYPFWQTCPRRAPNVKNRGPSRGYAMPIRSYARSCSHCRPASLFGMAVSYTRNSLSKKRQHQSGFSRPQDGSVKAGTSSQNSFNLLNHTNVSLLDAAFGSNGRAQSGLGRPIATAPHGASNSLSTTKNPRGQCQRSQFIPYIQFYSWNIFESEQLAFMTRFFPCSISPT